MGKNGLVEGRCMGEKYAGESSFRVVASPSMGLFSLGEGSESDDGWRIVEVRFAVRA